MQSNPRRARGSGQARSVATVDRIQSAAIHLLRRLRLEDAASGLSAPRLSALSVIVFAGPITLGDLAAAEQVRPPTMTRLVQALQRDGLVNRETDREDRRVVRVRATEKGRRILLEGRKRRVRALAERLQSLSPAELGALDSAATVLERVTGSRQDRQGKAPGRS